MFNLSESILNGLLIFSILQSFLFSVVLMTKKSRALPDTLLATWLSILGVQSILIFYIHNSPGAFPASLPLIITLLYGPFQFLYVSKICSGNVKMESRDLLHFIPFLVFSVLVFSFFREDTFKKIAGSASAVAGLSYCIASIFLLQKHKISVRDHFSYTEKVDLSWLKKLVRGLIMIWFGVLILVSLRMRGVLLSLDWFFIVIPLFIFYLGYHGIKQQVIYSVESKITGPSKTGTVGEQPPASKAAYKKSGLKHDQMSRINEEMVQLMQGESLYLDSTLSLQDLSEKLKIPPHHITQTLNEFCNLNFYDFVNNYRINEFIRRIDAGAAKNFSLLGIAFDCGFNSKSSFNRIFRNSTGLTPSEYKSKQY